jgi:hypothetical protein
VINYTVNIIENNDTNRNKNISRVDEGVLMWNSLGYLLTIAKVVIFSCKVVVVEEIGRFLFLACSQRRNKVVLYY